MAKDVIKRFLSKVSKSDGCWEWTASKQTYGYGKMWFNGRLECAHRISFILFKGEIPKGIFVCHVCDNPPCVNPEHLFLGTVGDNIRDMVKKGRHFRPKYNESKTHCPKGHPYSKDNTLVEVSKKTGYHLRRCKICRNGH
jgi:hypothetical protein